MQLLQTSFVLAAVPSAWSDYRPLNHPFIGIVVGLQPMLARLIGHEFSRMYSLSVSYCFGIQVGIIMVLAELFASKT
jgi:hypothetical protein